MAKTESFVSDMELKTYNIRQLTEFVKSDAFKSMPHLPISKVRALSQAKNPRASEDDVLLLTLTQGEQLCGYLGVLPDNLHVDGTISHFGWMSCLWVNENFRGQGVAKQLVAEALHCWGERLLATEFTAEAGDLYIRQCGFSRLTQLRGQRFYLKSDLANLLPPRHILFKLTQPLLHLLDTIANIAVVRSHNDQLPAGLSFESLLQPDDAVLIDAANANGCHRSVNDWNWLLQYPWIEAGDETEESRRYFFSSRANQFKQQVIRVRNSNGQTTSLLLCSIRNQHLKIPFIHLQNADRPQVKQAIQQLVHQLDIRTATVYDAQAVQLLSELPHLHKRAFTRDILVFKNKCEEMRDIQLQFADGDGDCGFT